MIGQPLSDDPDTDLEEPVLSFAVAEAEAGLRLDKALSLRLPDISRSRLKDLILAGHLTIGGSPAPDPSRKLRAGEPIVLILPEPVAAEPRPEPIPLSVVFEDAHLVVIDKPAGLVVHPAAGHQDGTLVNALLAHCGDSLSGIGGVKRPGIVHRIDKDTSGLLVVAKTDRAHQKLAAQFADHGRTGPLQRAYLAFVWGAPNRPNGTIDANLERSHHNREKIVVVPEGRGREAITHFSLLETYEGEKQPGGARPAVASLVECRLETGRTHQIRVHMASIGHPLLADMAYGSGFKTKAGHLGVEARDALSLLGRRQALHAALLGFEHPATGEEMVFESPLPPDLLRLKAALGQSS
ncbi:MAG: RluA family pseudouridine synthase [Beijerinckiaceae bacterium]|nr:RluA family pseudouridine synthase [Beijerinckiaceae bacterium]